ncbi:MAG: dihydroneopterin aldolase [Lentisphaeria bacterium]|nr:dihydroneopterin aldolase [Lentisphaeria bacterium]
MDKIILRGLPVGCVIGTLPAERTAPQTLFFDLELCGDFSRAGRTDDLNDAVDYTAVERCVKEYAAGTSFFLLERLAYACGEKLLEGFPLLDRVTLRIRKPDAPVESESIELEVTLARS